MNPKIRIGRWTASLVLVAVGLLLLSDELRGREDMLLLVRWWPAVFILWGAHAQAKAARIAALQGDTRHLVIRSPHPSPLSAYRGFFGSRPFSQANAFLAAHGRGAARPAVLTRTP